MTKASSEWFSALIFRGIH